MSDQPVLSLSSIAGVICDMDGVLWRGSEPLPGIADFFDFLRQRRLPFVLATNNSSKSPSDYVDKLDSLGVPGILPQQIVTSGTATANYLHSRYSDGAHIHVVGGDGLRQVLANAGFTLVDEAADAVVVGIDPQLTYDKLKRAALLIRAGAHFVGTNDDVTIPTAEGLAPGNGSILAALRAATDCQPTIIGKPHAPMFEAALRILGTPASNTLMVGDRLNTDIAGAQQAGLRAALVLTGVATPEMLRESVVQPDGVYADLPALLAAWD